MQPQTTVRPAGIRGSGRAISLSAKRDDERRNDYRIPDQHEWNIAGTEKLRGEKFFFGRMNEVASHFFDAPLRVRETRERLRELN
jgi:hypothetical protein